MDRAGGSGMLLEGFTPLEVRHALSSKPLPRPVRTTVGAVVGRRLRDLFAAVPAAEVRPILVQQRSDGFDALGRPEPQGGDEAWASPSWAEQRAAGRARTRARAPVAVDSLGNNTPSGAANPAEHYRVFYKTVPLDESRTVESVTLPNDPALHIFGLATKSLVGGAPTGDTYSTAATATTTATGLTRSSTAPDPMSVLGHSRPGACAVPRSARRSDRR
ncbi:hypothetical protein ACFVU4_01085 [Streptomyces sp. NPDC058107]|uniref:hypothetical protein n=1 Tax=Streptomyces sp. NPDC058107 TaxID=3346343 RepID=UPI0036EA9ED9